MGAGLAGGRESVPRFSQIAPRLFIPGVVLGGSPGLMGVPIATAELLVEPVAHDGGVVFGW